MCRNREVLPHPKHVSIATAHPTYRKRIFRIVASQIARAGYSPSRRVRWSNSSGNMRSYTRRLGKSLSDDFPASRELLENPQNSFSSSPRTIDSPMPAAVESRLTSSTVTSSILLLRLGRTPISRLSSGYNACKSHRKEETASRDSNPRSTDERVIFQMVVKIPYGPIQEKPRDKGPSIRKGVG